MTFDELVADGEKKGYDLSTADIVIAKIRPYLANLFLNEPEKNFIGTTELLPFNIVANDLDRSFLRYLLLSSDFIVKAELLMYGKEQPRMNEDDFQRMRVPVPLPSVQAEFVRRVGARESDLLAEESAISGLRLGIDELIFAAIDSA